MDIVIFNQICLQNTPAYLADEIKARLTIPNPDFIGAERLDELTENIPPTINCYNETKDGLMIPRPFLRELLQRVQKHGIEYEIEDLQNTLPDVPFNFAGKLKEYQEEAVKEILTNDFGVLKSSDREEKMIMALAVIAERKQPCLVIVQNKESLDEWYDFACQYLNLEQGEIGVIGNGMNDIGYCLTIGIVDTVYPIACDIHEYFGFIVVDDCDCCPIWTFTKAVSYFFSRYQLGLSDTSIRQDGLERLIYLYLGDEVYTLDKGRLVKNSVAVIYDFLKHLDPTVAASAQQRLETYKR